MCQWLGKTANRNLVALNAIMGLRGGSDVFPVEWASSAVLALVNTQRRTHARRGEAWEYGEEVEENHISTLGHGVRPKWMTDEEAAQFEQHGK